jgi:hypothetical protein
MYISIIKSKKKNVLLNRDTDNSACPLLEHALTNMAKACWYMCKAIYVTCDGNHEFFIPERVLNQTCNSRVNEI